MAYEREQFRIIPDARQPGRWAYEATLPGRAAETVAADPLAGLQALQKAMRDAGLVPASPNTKASN